MAHKISISRFNQGNQFPSPKSIKTINSKFSPKNISQEGNLKEYSNQKIDDDLIEISKPISLTEKPAFNRSKGDKDSVTVINCNSAERMNA